MSDTIPHCQCGHNTPPHTDTHCHHCDCAQLKPCACGGMGMPDDWTADE